MRKTRYYQKKNDGKFFSKLPKDDQNQSIQDGRLLRDWTFGNDTGQTLGYEEKELVGVIESAYIQKFESGDKMFCVGLQHQDGVDVFQCDLTSKYGLNDDVCAFGLRFDAIDLDCPVSLSVYVGKPNAKGFQKAYLNINQFGKPVWPNFKKTDKFSYEGVPDMEEVTKLGETTYDSTKRDDFLFEKVQEFMKMVEAKGHKDKREATPAEAAPSGPDVGDGDDLPF